MTDTATPTADAAKLRTAKARELEALALRTGDDLFSRAARVLRGGHTGRRAIDDSRALAMVAGLVEQGIASSLHEACETVAELVSRPCHPHLVLATRDRLRRKIRTKFRTKRFVRPRAADREVPSPNHETPNHETGEHPNDQTQDAQG